MCKAIEKIAERNKAEGKAEGIAEGEARGKRENMLATARRLLANGKLMLKEIAECTGLSLAQVACKGNTIKENNNMRKHTWKAAVSAAVAASASFQLTATELITNGGFEECEEGCTPPAQFENLSASLKLSGWTWGGSVGMSKSYSNCPWLRVGTLNGDYALYFQKIASITQTIDVVEAGTYVASFGYIARADNTCYGNGRFLC